MFGRWNSLRKLSGARAYGGKMNALDKSPSGPARHHCFRRQGLRFCHRTAGSCVSGEDRTRPGYRSGLPVSTAIQRSPFSPALHAIAASWSPAIMARANRRTSSRSPRGSTGPCVRVNLDSHISRIDLIGKDAIVLKEGKQVTEFRDGILPWAYQNKRRACFRRV